MARTRTSRLLITEVYTSNIQRITVHDEATGNMRDVDLAYPSTRETVAEAKQKLIDEVKELNHAKSDRRSKASVSNSAPALPNTTLASRPA